MCICRAAFLYHLLLWSFTQQKLQIPTMLPRSLLLALVSAVLPYTNAKSLWSNSPANTSDVIRTTYPIGNGRLGAMPIGPPWAETLTLNLDTLWSGGPFDASVSSSLPTKSHHYTDFRPRITQAVTRIPQLRLHYLVSATGSSPTAPVTCQSYLVPTAFTDHTKS